MTNENIHPSIWVLVEEHTKDAQNRIDIIGAQFAGIVRSSQNYNDERFNAQGDSIKALVEKVAELHQRVIELERKAAVEPTSVEPTTAITTSSLGAMQGGDGD